VLEGPLEERRRVDSEVGRAPAWMVRRWATLDPCGSYCQRRAGVATFQDGESATRGREVREPREHFHAPAQHATATYECPSSQLSALGFLSSPADFLVSFKAIVKASHPATLQKAHTEPEERRGGEHLRSSLNHRQSEF
jgi:hypothetical protein